MNNQQHDVETARQIRRLSVEQRALWRMYLCLLAVNGGIVLSLIVHIVLARG